MTGNMSYAYPYPNYLVVCPTHCQGLRKYLFIFCVYMCILYVLLLFSCPVISDVLWSKFMSIESVMTSSHLILWPPPLLLLPSIFPSIRDFPNESAVHIRWPKHWSFSFSISLSNEYSGLISLKIDWFDLLAVQRTLRSLLQHTVRRHQFFGALPSLWSSSHNYMWPLGSP